MLVGFIQAVMSRMRFRTLKLLLLRGLRLLRRTRSERALFAAEKPVQRAELFNAEQLELRGRTLANEHTLLAGHGPDRLLARLSANEVVLREATMLLAEAIKIGHGITPAGDWLLDNFYLIEEQIHTARQHLPKGYSWELPRLAEGASAGLPRAYDLALEAISHGDGRVDASGLMRFLAAYQQQEPLSLGELWAIPIMLRLSLIENLRQVAARVASDRIDCDLAAAWAERMSDVARTEPSNLILVIADMARSAPPMASAFVAELARRLQGQGAALTLPLGWVEQRLATLGVTTEQLVLAENAQQASDQVSISNSIASLRLLSVVDWRDFVEALSHAEQVLRRDPAGVYAGMDFLSRDRYRHVLEALSKRSDQSETAIAEAALALASGSAHAPESPLRHVGYYLVDDGLIELEISLGIPQPNWWRGGRYPITAYLSVIAAVTGLLTYHFVQIARSSGEATGILVLIGALAAIATSQFGVAIAHWMAALLVYPYNLARMDFSKGLIPGTRTLVVVPSMLGSVEAAEKLLEDLEIRYLANQDAELFFALLTDFPDAPKLQMASDESVLAAAKAGIDRLNEKYASNPEHSGFLLLHRARVWNAAEGVFMGPERKRGKLEALNALISGHADPFDVKHGALAELSEVRYVITLDTDTQLPRDSARLLVATLHHPLNCARRAADGEGFVAGYGILQPRLGSAIPAQGSSRYAKLFGGELGLDPYTRAVSDVYQDLFAEGSFVGKGIYQVASFEHALRGRFPDNRILSHDLLEGCYARAGLVSDVELFEHDPQRYNAELTRRHRWIRGDWLLVDWLLPRVPDAQGKRVKNPLSALSRWKILDNLRRSLAAPALFALLILGWVALQRPVFWTAAVLLVVFLPLLVDALLELLNKHRQAGFAEHLSAAAHAIARRCAQAVFNFACLPFEAINSLDAILRTLWRRYVSGRRVLEWTPSQLVEARARDDWWSVLRSTWVAPACAAALAAYLSLQNFPALRVALPLLALWMAAPIAVWWLGRPVARQHAALNAADRQFLRRVARRTWGFFERFVTAQDHWLPPDNYQEQPVPALAHRTSPTNIGLALLANLSAYDFGYLSQKQLLERCQATLSSMARLPRFRGHFYNWYDTQTLQPLNPHYVSAVDSGNLSGHLLTLAQGFEELPQALIVPAKLLSGILDTWNVCLEERVAASLPTATSPEAATQDARLPSTGSAITAKTHALLSDLETRPVSAQALYQLLQQIVLELPSVLSHTDQGYLARLHAQCAEALQELESWAPWVKSAVPPRFAQQMATVQDLASLEALSQGRPDWFEALRNVLGKPLSELESAWLDTIAGQLEQLRAAAQVRIELIASLARDAVAFSEVDYEFLYDRTRKLFAIGYDVHARRRDNSFYDLLASEARLGCFVAIAYGGIPQASWFALGRSLTRAQGEAVLLSWSGSMFEYLMPALVMPSYPGSLLAATCAAAVRAQASHGARNGVAWGVSESGYNLTDAALNYQYRAFGITGLGLKRGLSEDLVIAPYASALALLVDPNSACANLQRLAAEGALAQYGFYEAIDHTPGRLRPGESQTLVQSFMAHHQGMSLLALLHLLHDAPMQRRFCADPRFNATLLLLQERVPKARGYYANSRDMLDLRSPVLTPETPVRVFTKADGAVPAVQLLSNGRYHLMISSAGGGYSRCRELALTRWREDSTRDYTGAFCYLHELETGAVWSTTLQPTLEHSVGYRATFTEARVEFHRRSEHLDVHTQIAVSPEDDIELRRCEIRNHSRTVRTIELTSYAEVVLGAQAADAIHPAFSNLFVETEVLPARQAILCTRRPRSAHEATPCMLHRLTIHGTQAEQISFETDRARFIGRGNSTINPAALQQAGVLSNSAGSVLDPIIAIRCRITLEPEQSVRLDWVTGVSETRESALALVDKYQDLRMTDRVFELAWTHSQVALRQLNVTEAEAQLYGRLAGSIIYCDSNLRAGTELLRANRRGQSGLWGYAISGDLPIVLVQIKDSTKLELVRQLIQAHGYWRMRGLAVDLVIWNEEQGGYRQTLQEEILGLLGARVELGAVERAGGIFVRASEQMSSEDRTLLQAVARVVFSDNRGTLAEQVKARERPAAAVAPLITTRKRLGSSEPVPRTASESDFSPDPLAPNVAVQLLNGLGGFNASGREYLITTNERTRTPAPWCNVLANAAFGCVISESGGGYTFKENAHEFRLTPWHNDPISDASGEAFYIRDEETGDFWSPTPLPARGRGDYTTRHGFGYSAFEHEEDGIASEFWIYLDPNAPVKFFVLRVRNESTRARSLSLTGYVEWVLGESRAKTAMHVVTELDSETGALFARNAYHSEFGSQIAFFDVDSATRTLSGDRREFLGRNGHLSQPVALRAKHLSGRVGAGMDPCGAIQVPFELAPGSRHQIIFRLGVGATASQASALVRRFRQSGSARAAFAAVTEYWQRTLGSVQVQTPDAAVNLLTNGWLVYQTLACRLMARSGYYQSGGAFGFRDQLQDAMALVHAAPERLRAQLLLCASRQFVEGDVQHWWHPPSGRGVRTACSDDLLWLPLAACRYVSCTGDSAVLEESCSFLSGRALPAGEDSYYDLPQQHGESASLYQHCVRALERVQMGVRGLPLIGGGDWNDGMNRVGIHGRGESVWLGFFFYSVLQQFAELARSRGDAAVAEVCEQRAKTLQQKLEQHAWDGAWYRRAYFDDGTPLGSSTNLECQIDSIAQSWSVLSGAGSIARTQTALKSLDARLVREDAALIQLLDPPFDKLAEDPGYIRGYVPGVRENGGQYTHAAIWAVMAFAQAGQVERAWQLFELINPLRHADSAEKVAKYKVEPYVVAADVYAVAPHTGRGGWTWYTGSASWMYRLVLESLLGLQRKGARLVLEPKLPAAWPGLWIRYRFGSSTYLIEISRASDASASLHVDGEPLTGNSFELSDDGRERVVLLKVANPPEQPVAPVTQP